MDEQTPTAKPALADRTAADAEPTAHHPAPTGDGMVALSYFLAGIVFYGGLGWAGAHYLDQVWMLPLGLVLGFVVSMYLVIKRYSPTESTLTRSALNMSSQKEQ